MQRVIVILFVIISLNLYADALNLSFEEAIDLALKNNPQILANKAQIDVYISKSREVFSGFLPQLNASAIYKRTTLNSPPQVNLKLPPSLSTISSSIAGKRESMDSYNNYTFGLTLNQLVWDFGKTSGLYRATEKMKDSTIEDLRSTSDNLIINLYQTVLGYLLNQELYKAALSYEKQMESHLEMAKAQVKAGVRTNIDVLKAESDLYNARLNSLKMKNLILISKVNIKNLLGISEEVDFEISPPQKGENLQIPSPPNYEYIQKRPEYLSLKMKIESLRETLRSARAGYFPSLSLLGGLSYNGYQLDGLVYNWNIGGQLNWNLFSGFYTQSYEQEVRAQIRSLEASLQQVIQSINLEIENSKILYRESMERLELSKALLKVAEESLNLTEARYRSGLGTFIEVSDAQNVYINAKNSVIQAEYDLMLAEVRLKKALGILNYKRGE
jgi:outer membrane protein